MAIHTRHLRTLGLGPDNNALIINLIAGGDLETLNLLFDVAAKSGNTLAHRALRALDGFHLYGPDIINTLIKECGNDRYRFIDMLIDGHFVCAQCGIAAMSKDVCNIIQDMDMQNASLLRSLPKSASAGSELTALYDGIMLNRARQEKGSLEFFADRFGEVKYPNTPAVVIPVSDILSILLSQHSK